MTPLRLIEWALAVLFAAVVLFVVAAIAKVVHDKWRDDTPKNGEHLP